MHRSSHPDSPAQRHKFVKKNNIFFQVIKQKVGFSQVNMNCSSLSTFDIIGIIVILK